MASAIAPIPKIPRPHWLIATRSPPPGSAARPAPCSHPPPPPTPAKRRCPRGWARALAKNGISKHVFVFPPRPLPPKKRVGFFFWGQGPVPKQRGGQGAPRRYYASALKIVPDEPS